MKAKSSSTTFRLSLGLTSLAVSLVCTLHSLGFLPDATAGVLAGRKSLCEAIAIYCSSAAVRDDRALIASSTRSIVARNPDIISATVRLADGTIIVAEGAPPSAAALGALTTRSLAQVPIYLNDRRWGTVEVAFRSLGPLKPMDVLNDSTWRFIAAFALATLLADWLFLSIVLRRERSVRGEAIPQRIRATLDTLVEGVLLMDNRQRIAMVNASFAKTVGLSPAEIEGLSAHELGWTESVPDHPWGKTIENGSARYGAIVGLNTSAQGQRTLSVNTTAILDDDGACRGALATFDDMTHIERKNLQLRKLLEKLKMSRSEIRDQNEKLKDLANVDPLTRCLNRRAFFERFEPAWKTAGRHDQPLSCIMLDIDHFKSVNDRFGHAVGDQAIQVVSGVLRAMVRASDLVCRYGGEEFCVLLPQTAEPDAVLAAERFRVQIAASPFAGISVTASFGVSSIRMGASDPHGLLDQADQALYAAKRGGRNRVVRFDEIPADVPKPKTETEPESKAAPVLMCEKPGSVLSQPLPEPCPSDGEVPIPYHAVTSLVSALAHRDPSTAEHSRRVAALCVIATKGLLSERDCYVLEIAAMLHDIGKLGIPDAILQKPGPLTDDEWEVMRAHDLIGLEIIAAAFSSEPLCEIIRTHHAWFDGNPTNSGLPQGSDIPLGSRVLAIADAYDAIVSDRVYRKGRSREEAFVELRRCAGKQFDPVLVDRFINALIAHDESRLVPFSPLSKQNALKIGLVIEKLADALDAKDLVTLKASAARIRATAVEHRISAVGESASLLEQAIDAQGEWLEVLERAIDLLDLCRSTQTTYLATYAQTQLPDRAPVPAPHLPKAGRRPGQPEPPPRPRPAAMTPAPHLPLQDAPAGPNGEPRRRLAALKDRSWAS
jgi:diguanylate cyclase (GGDEF)-like protein/PAS domain S-box-containing protein